MGNVNSGRRPQSAALRALRGNPSKTRIQPDLVAPAGRVEKPTTLSPGAAAVWDELAPVARAMQTLSSADVKAFATLCELQASFTANAQRKGKATFDPREERALAAALRPFYALFGLEPASRSRIKIAPVEPVPVSKWAAAGA
jgi:phage terminase small subunit